MVGPGVALVQTCATWFDLSQPIFGAKHHQAAEWTALVFNREYIVPSVGCRCPRDARWFSFSLPDKATRNSARTPLPTTDDEVND